MAPFFKNLNTVKMQKIGRVLNYPEGQNSPLGRKTSNVCFVVVKHVRTARKQFLSYFIFSFINW